MKDQRIRVEVSVRIIVHTKTQMGLASVQDLSGIKMIFLKRKWRTCRSAYIFRQRGTGLASWPFFLFGSEVISWSSKQRVEIRWPKLRIFKQITGIFISLRGSLVRCTAHLLHKRSPYFFLSDFSILPCKRWRHGTRIGVDWKDSSITYPCL